MGGVYAYPGGGTPGRVHLAPGQARARDRRILRPVCPLELEDIKACLSFVRGCLATQARSGLYVWRLTNKAKPVSPCLIGQRE